jgi:ABC-type branched-subunit amino acid transport system ATPase component
MNVLLSATDLTCRFGRLAALDGVDLELRAGERRAIIGPNGAGKTTLVNLLTGTVRPASGRVTFAGRDITTARPARRARLGIARTFQTPALADSLTALDNVVIGARRQPERVLHALRQLAILGIARAAHTPAGQLAHGQRRLLEIAVALAARPRLLLLDEPAAGLTDADLPRLLDCLHRLPDQVTVLLVEHHMDVVTAVATTVTVLHHGRVVATGTPTAIATDPTVAEIYLGTGEMVS